MSADTENANGNPTPSEPRDPVLGVTRYDRVTALLLTLIVTSGGATIAFGALWAANQDWRSDREPVPIGEQPTLEDDDEDFGGILSGAVNDTSPPAPGVASNDPAIPENPDEATSDAPALELVIGTVKDQFTEASIDPDQLTIQLDFPRSNSSRGSDTMGVRGPLGNDKGMKGGVSRAKRWEIIFESGLSEVEYARQLDFFMVELATMSDGKLIRVSNLASPRPTARLVQPDKKELFFQWRDAARRAVDLGLLRKVAGITVTENSHVFHFYPRETELKLLQLETDYATRQGRPDLHQVAKTKFVVKKTETGYDFEVAKQMYFVQQM
jgi:hypothetical protein